MSSSAETPKKIVVVFGATGAQGGAVLRALLATPDYSVRAVTRHPESDKAKALAELDGVEVVQANASDLEQVTQALEGAYGAFFVTNPFDPTSCATPDTECHQVKNFATAADAVGLKHAIWSTTENPLDDIGDSDAIPSITHKTSDGGTKDYKVPHFENKALGDQFFEQADVPTTYVLPGFFYDNFFSYFPLERDAATGRLGFCIPTGDASIPMVSAEDIGKFVCAIFQAGSEACAGKKLGIAAEHLTMDAVAKTLGTVLDESVANNPHVTAEMLATFGFPGCKEISNMFLYERDYNEQYRSRRGVEATRDVCSDLTSFAEYAQENKERFLQSVDKVVG